MPPKILIVITAETYTYDDLRSFQVQTETAPRSAAIFQPTSPTPIAAFFTDDSSFRIGSCYGESFRSNCRFKSGPPLMPLQLQRHGPPLQPGGAIKGAVPVADRLWDIAGQDQ